MNTDFRRLGNLLTWLDMKQLNRSVIDSSGNMQTWGDVSGHGNDFTQATAANRPAIVTDTLGGQRVLRGNGTSTELDSSQAIGGSIEAYVVARATRAPGATVDDRIEYLLCSENSQAYNGTSTPFGASMFIYNVYGAYGNAAWNNVCNTDSHGGGTNVTYQNGLISSSRVVAQNQWGVFGFSGTGIVSSPFQLWKTPDATAYIGQCDIAEVLIFGQAHNQPTRDYIIRALEKKWGIVQYG